MELHVHVEGEVVERSELLNGTCTIAIEGETADGRWQIAGVVSWNRGLVEYVGEGDLSVAGSDGEVFASLTASDAEAGGEDETDVRLAVSYEIDGGSGRFDDAAGTVEGSVRVAGDRFEGAWTIAIPDST